MVAIRLGVMTVLSIAIAAAGIGRLCAQDYPSKTMRMVVPFAPGGTTDIVARLLSQKMSEPLGQLVLVENKAGASSIIGTDAVAKAAPDGYTMLMATNSGISSNPLLFKNLPYKASDFLPVALAGFAPFVLVAPPSLPANSLKDLVGLSKSRPASLSFGNLGSGSSVHLLSEGLKSYTGMNLVGIPYKGSAPALTDLLGGQIDVYFDSIPTSLGHLQSGKLKAIALTSGSRSHLIPSVPTFKELGVPEMEIYSWFGILVPARTPRPIIDKLNRAANAALNLPEVANRLKADGALVSSQSPDQFGEFVNAQSELWGRIIKPLNIQLD